MTVGWSRSGPSGSRAPSRDSGVGLIVLLGALSMFAPLSTDMYLPALPSASHDLSASASAIQLTLTASLLGLGTGQLIAGPVSDAFGRRRPLLVGLVVYSLASVLCALSPSVWILIVLRLVQGAAGAAGIVIARAVVRDLHAGSDAARIFSRLVLVMGAAPVLAPLIGAQLLHVTDWRGIFVVLAAIGVVLTACSWRWLAETLPPARRRRGGSVIMIRALGGLARDRTFMGYTLCYGLYFGAVFAYISSSPFIYQTIFGASPQLFSILFGASAAVMVTVGRIGARVVDRVHPRRLLAVGLTGGAAASTGLVVAVLAHAGLVPVFLCFMGLIGSFGLIAPNASALALEDHPHQAGSASGMMGVTQFSIGAAVAPIVGLGGNHSAVPAAVVVAALVAAALTALALLRPGRQAYGSQCVSATGAPV